MEKGKKMGLAAVVPAVVLPVLLLLPVLVAVDGEGLCDMSSDDLRECKPAITAPNPAVPTMACCAALANANLPCFCSYKDSSLLPMFGVDPDLAVQLPSKCGITPPTSC